MGSWPKMKPKSMWNIWPEVLIMMLSRCRSPMPRMYVITQYPAQLLMNVSSALQKEGKGIERKEEREQVRRV